MAGSLLLLTCWQLCETLVPVFIGLVIDRAVATSALDLLLWWGLGLAALFTVLSFSYRFGARLGYGVVQREMHRLRMEIAAHSLHPRGARSGLLPGETLSLATSDTTNVGFALRSLGYTASAVGSLALSAWVLLRIDVVLGLVVLLGAPLVLVLIQVLTPVVALRTRHHQASAALATGIATDLVRGLRVLKGIGAEDVAAERYRGHSRHARLAGIRSAESFGGMLGLTSTTGGLFLALVALLAGRLAVEGEITIGELVVVVGLTQYLAEPLEVLGSISAQVAQAHASARRIVEHLATPPLVAAGPTDPAGPATVELDGLRGEHLPPLTLRSAPGELLGLAIEDPAAAGELVRLLAEGSSAVRLAGSPLDDLATTARHRLLVVAPHQVDLFEGTLRSNVDPLDALGPDRLVELLDASAAADVVALVPDGLEQHVTPDGAAYSGGQRQRIALARALAADAPVLVLHDPTTAVDSVTEQRIASGIRAARHAPGSDRTTWVLTSAPALLAQADRVVLVRADGTVVEGSHHELAADPVYRELVLR